MLVDFVNIIPQIDYSVTLPEGTSAADVDKVKTASSSGGTGASAFAASLKTAVNTEITNHAELSALGIVATSAIVTGTARMNLIPIIVFPKSTTSTTTPVAATTPPPTTMTTSTSTTTSTTSTATASTTTTSTTTTSSTSTTSASQNATEINGSNSSSRVLSELLEDEDEDDAPIADEEPTPRSGEQGPFAPPFPEKYEKLFSLKAPAQKIRDADDPWFSPTGALILPAAERRRLPATAANNMTDMTVSSTANSSITTTTSPGDEGLHQHPIVAQLIGGSPTIRTVLQNSDLTAQQMAERIKQELSLASLSDLGTEIQYRFATENLQVLAKLIQIETNKAFGEVTLDPFVFGSDIPSVSKPKLLPIVITVSNGAPLPTTTTKTPVIITPPPTTTSTTLAPVIYIPPPEPDKTILFGMEMPEFVMFFVIPVVLGLSCCCYAVTK